MSNTLRYDVPSEDAGAIAPHETPSTSRVVGNVTRVTVSGERATTETVAARRVTNDPVETRRSGGLQIDLSNARDSRDGLPVAPGRIDADSIIRIGGMEVRVEDAISAGLLDSSMLPASTNRNEASFVDAIGSEEELEGPKQQEEPRPNFPASEPIDPAATATLDTVLMDANDEALGLATEFLDSGGEMTEESIGALASRLEIEPAQVEQMAERVRVGFEQQAVAQGARVTGGDLELAREALEWASEEKRGEFIGAAMRQLHARDAQGYEPLVREYLANLDTIDPEALLTATLPKGASIRQEPTTGEILLTAPGFPEMTWKNAVHAGIAFPRKRR